LLAQDRTPVSQSVQERTGHAIRPQAGANDLKTPGFPPGLTFAGKLSEEDSVAIALWNNSAFQATLKDLGVAEADLLEAGLLRNPSFQVLLPLAGKPFEFLLQWPIETFWQRPRRVEAAQANLSQVGQSLIQAGLDVVRQARLAHAEVALAERRRAAATEALQLRRQIAALTEKRLAAGDISEFEANLARIDARSVEETVNRASRDVEAAAERLRMTLGLRGTGQALSAVEPAVGTAQPPEREDLLKTAMEARPDLRAAELAVESAARNARWEKSKVAALVAPLLSVKESGSPAKVRSGPGLQAELPIFNRNQGRIRRADAEVERAAVLYLAARDRVEAEIREARVQLVQALESLELIRTEVRPATQKSIQLAQSAYADGDTSFLSVLEAGRQIYDVQMREAEAIAGVQRARAALEHGIGRRL
jgi:cobalt-zinc-cadmium efflux system outer membrane protein